MMAMSLNMIVILYVITCIFSCDFTKLAFWYIHVYNYIIMTNKSKNVMSVCLSSNHKQARSYQ